MHHSFLGRAVPAALTTAGVAVPSLTAALIMLHAMVPGAAAHSALSASSTAPSATATSTPKATATSTPKAATAAPAQLAATATPSPTAVTTHTITGPAIDDPFGTVQATITVAGNKITNVSIAAPQDNPRSASINQQAVSLLQTETLQAQSANVNVISGATVTSEAYIQSLQSALQTTGL